MPTAPFLAAERDDRYRFGRGQTATSYYVIPGWVNASINNTGAMTAGVDRYYPMFLEVSMVVDQMAFEVTGASAGNARVGIYRADAQMQPTAAPLVDSGDISTGSTGVKTFTPGSPLYLPRGRYLSVFNCSATPTLRYAAGCYIGGQIYDTVLGSTGSLHDWRVTRSYAAFPTPGTAWDTVTGIATARVPIFLRVLAL